MPKHNRKNVKVAWARMESKCAKCGATIPLGEAHFLNYKKDDFRAYCIRCYEREKGKNG